MQPAGLAVHIGWQIATLAQMTAGIETVCMFARDVWSTLAEEGIELTTLDLGGGWPNQFRGAPVPSIAENADVVRGLIGTYFGDKKISLILEPGNYISAAAGITKCAAINIDTVPGEPNHIRCVLNAGVFNGGLLDKHYPVSMLLAGELYEVIARESTETDTMRFSAFGPSCDSVDVVLENLPLHSDTRIRSHLSAMLHENTASTARQITATFILHGTGAYTSEFTVGSLGEPGFNGIYNPGLIVLRSPHPHNETTDKQ
jgi:ornithine decarboxylase